MKEKVLRIAEDFNKCIKERIDELLRIDADMYTNLGIDSLKKDKEQVKTYHSTPLSQKLIFWN